MNLNVILFLKGIKIMPQSRYQSQIIQHHWPKFENKIPAFSKSCICGHFEFIQLVLGLIQIHIKQSLGDLNLEYKIG